MNNTEYKAYLIGSILIVDEDGKYGEGEMLWSKSIQSLENMLSK